MSAEEKLPNIVRRSVPIADTGPATAANVEKPQPVVGPGEHVVLYDTIEGVLIKSDNVSRTLVP